MKLDAAAALFRSTRSLRFTILVALAAASLLLSAGGATALDGIDLSTPAVEVGDGDCSRLVQIKYPFLRCMDGEIGLAAGNDTWENSRRIPIQGDWNEGDGYWGPSLNED